MEVTIILSFSDHFCFFVESSSLFLVCVIIVFQSLYYLAVSGATWRVKKLGGKL